MSFLMTKPHSKLIAQTERTVSRDAKLESSFRTKIEGTPGSDFQFLIASVFGQFGRIISWIIYRGNASEEFRDSVLRNRRRVFAMVG